MKKNIGKYTKIALACSIVFLGAESNTAMARNFVINAFGATPVVESASSEDTVTSVSVFNGSATVTGENIRVQGLDFRL